MFRCVSHDAVDLWRWRVFPCSEACIHEKNPRQAERVNIPDKDGATAELRVPSKNKHLLGHVCCFVNASWKIRLKPNTRNTVYICLFIYVFSGCQCLVGLSHGKAKVCYYSGWYYCQSCHQDNSFLIPARLLHNWDTNKHKVSKFSPDPQNRQL